MLHGVAILHGVATLRNTFMSRDIVPLGLRMPPDLKDRIEAAAKTNGRSMNAEIVSRLQASFDQSSLKQSVNADIQEYAAANGLTYQEALNALVASALMSPPVYYVSIEAGASMRDISTSIKRLNSIAPDAASVIVERK